MDQPAELHWELLARQGKAKLCIAGGEADAGQEDLFVNVGPSDDYGFDDVSLFLVVGFAGNILFEEARRWLSIISDFAYPEKT